MIAASWLAGFHIQNETDLNNISYDKFTHLTFSFAEPLDDGTLSLADSGEEYLPKFAKLAQKNGVKALVSIGGWYGSRFFSNRVADGNRTSFVKAVATFATQHNLDGIEIDWEYPGEVGACNAHTTADATNLLAFFRELRSTPGMGNLTLTAAVPPRVWEMGNNATTVGAFADVLDYISIMNYDVYGSVSSTAGPNAPIDDPAGSASSGVKAWTDAGFPPSKLVLGVASYGHTFSVSAKNASSDGLKTLDTHPSFNASSFPLGGEDDPADFKESQVDVCGAPEMLSGVWDFKQLVSSGLLNATGQAVSSADMVFQWDSTSQTPILYNKTSEEWITYDDPDSFAVKGEFIRKNGLAGFGMYELANDVDDLLVDAIRGSMYGTGRA